MRSRKTPRFHLFFIFTKTTSNRLVLSWKTSILLLNYYRSWEHWRTFQDTARDVSNLLLLNTVEHKTLSNRQCNTLSRPMFVHTCTIEHLVECLFFWIFEIENWIALTCCLIRPTTLDLYKNFYFIKFKYKFDLAIFQFFFWNFCKKCTKISHCNRYLKL